MFCMLVPNAITMPRLLNKHEPKNITKIHV